MNRTRPWTVAASAVAIVLSFTACGDDLAVPASPPATPQSTTASTAPSSSTLPTTTLPGDTVSAAELDEATRVATTFVDSLGRGDLDAAAATVGPVSEEHAAASGGLRAMLQQSTEGHGAWLGAVGRTISAIGVDHGLVVVVMEGTLSVEGNREHRVAAFPVRKAESASAWFVEPWAYEIAGTPPLLVRSPAVDPFDLARVETDEPFAVTVETALAGRIWLSVDDRSPHASPVDVGPRSTTVSADAAERVVVLFESGPTLYAKAFRVVDDDAPTTTSPSTTMTSSPVVAVPFVAESTNQLLRSCAAGNDASCDAAQVPGVLDDGVFSFLHRQCSGGDRTYCVLLDHLVEAELRMHEAGG
jgi:hypothetical protein